MPRHAGLALVTVLCSMAGCATPTPSMVMTELPGLCLREPVLRTEHGLVVSDASGAVYCVEEGSGEILWRREPLWEWEREAGDGRMGIEGPAITGGALQASDGIIIAYMGRLGGEDLVFCLAEEDGKTLWRREMPGLAAVVTAGEEVYCEVYSDAEWRVLCLDAKTGTVKWRRQAQILPAGNGDILICPELSQTDPGSTQRILKGPLGRTSQVVVLPWVLPKGAENNVVRLAGSRTAVGNGSPAVIGDITHSVMQVEPDPNRAELLCRDALTGKVHWHRPLPDDMTRSPGIFRWLRSLIPCDDRIVVVVSSSALACFHRDGQYLWHQPVSLVPTSGPASVVVGKGLVYVAEHPRTIKALSLETGGVVWQRELKAGMPNALSLLHDRLYVTTAQGRIVRLDLPVPVE